MAETYDMGAEAALLELLPPETEGQAQYRELVRGPLSRCFEQAAALSPEGRRKVHIELANGQLIGTAEIAAHFGDAALAQVDLKPTDLV